ncbi:MAG TPA: formyltransferase family protein [Thermodesulfobacteriota bacterium]|nr:formyltransferase family protein [Thermodesulfobacteriota bacterium]
MIKPIHNPEEGPLKLVGFMSGSGTNIRKILEHQIKLEKQAGTSPFKLVVLFSDNMNSNASKIGMEYDIPVIIRDIAGFYAQRGKKRSDLSIRPEFDAETVKALSPFEVKVGVYGGYMSVVTSPVINAFLGVNVHPADLSIEEGGKRKFTGDHAVRDAILAGEKTISSTTHIVEETVDQGPILMISPPLPVIVKKEWDLSNPEHLKQAEAFNQERLKENGDWLIFPKTIEYLATGRYGKDETGKLYCDGKPIPRGVRYEF